MTGRAKKRGKGKTKRRTRKKQRRAAQLAIGMSVIALLFVGGTVGYVSNAIRKGQHAHLDLSILAVDLVFSGIAVWSVIEWRRAKE